MKYIHGTRRLFLVSTLLYLLLLTLTLLQSRAPEIKKLSSVNDVPGVAAEGIIEFQRGRIFGLKRSILYKQAQVLVPQFDVISAEDIVRNGWHEPSEWKINWGALCVGYIWMVGFVFVGSVLLLRLSAKKLK